MILGRIPAHMCTIAVRDCIEEIRSSLTTNRIGRVLFCIRDGQLIALHGFIKKTRKTPDAELKLAKKRMTEVTRS